MRWILIIIWEIDRLKKGLKGFINSGDQQRRKSKASTIRREERK
jgi:hypothetical protein